MNATILNEQTNLKRENLPCSTVCARLIRTHLRLIFRMGFCIRERKTAPQPRAYARGGGLGL